MESENLHNDLILTEEEYKNSSTEKRILDISGHWEVTGSRTTDELHEKLMQRIQAKEKLEIKSQKNYYWPMAAAILALVGLFFLFQSPEKLVKTSFAENTCIELPDGSSVTLNAESKLTYNKKEFIHNRVLFLEGEAYFEVQKGSRFTINTSSGKVEILGTSLNVLSREKQFNVACLTGKVKVSFDNQSEIIYPGEKTELKDQKLTKFIGQNINQMATWRNGIFRFDDQPLIYIFDEIERQYHVTIQSSGIDKRFYTGAFTNKNLVEALETVCIPMNLKYDIQKGNKIIISEKKD